MEFKNIKKDNYILEKNKLGYFEVINKPSSDELNDFYANQLYQEPEKHTSSYKINYCDEELEYIENKSKKIYEIVKNIQNKNLLDIGCGEGYVSRFFLDLGYQIKSIDFSEFAVKNHNPSVLPYFKKGDVFKNLDDIIKNEEKYGLIILNNVIEHVLDPIDILMKIKKLMYEDSIIVVTAPNDFSNLQEELLEKKYIDVMTWIAPPAHLSYFTLNSLKNLIQHCNLNVYDYYVEYPIDFDLFVENTNYVKNKDVGKYSHLKRLRVDNFLCKQSIPKTIEYYKKLAELNVGRDIVIFIKN